jgi:hypothetical protein
MVYATQRFGMVIDIVFCRSLLVARWMQGVQKAGNRQPIRSIALRFKRQSQWSRTEKLMRTSRWIASIWPISNITRDHLWVTRKSWKNKRIEYSWERCSQRRRSRFLGSCKMGRRMICRVRTIDSELGSNHMMPGPWLIACWRECLHSDERIRTLCLMWTLIRYSTLDASDIIVRNDGNTARRSGETFDLSGPHNSLQLLRKGRVSYMDFASIFKTLYNCGLAVESTHNWRWDGIIYIFNGVLHWYRKHHKVKRRWKRRDSLASSSCCPHFGMTYVSTFIMRCLAHFRGSESVFLVLAVALLSMCVEKNGR